ncbi:MAG: hypothetical protein GY768_06650 [Planctomycetaceae bacterium]|nr:hypothetical protein [Planctomycetaceae bacterium]
MPTSSALTTSSMGDASESGSEVMEADVARVVRLTTKGGIGRPAPFQQAKVAEIGDICQPTLPSVAEIVA